MSNADVAYQDVQSSGIEPSDYLERLTRFRAAAQEFRTSLSDFVADRVAQFSAEHGKPKIKLLEIGSSAGTLLGDVLAKSAHALDLQTILALEPDNQSFVALKQNDNLKQWKVQFRQSTLEDFIASSTIQSFEFNVVLLSHIFYHFDQPRTILEVLRAQTSKPAILIIAHDSHECPLYRFIDRVRESRNLVPTEQYGSYLSAEELRADFEDSNCAIEQTNLESTLQLGTCSEFVDAVEFLGRRRLRSQSDASEVCIAAAEFGLPMPGEYALGQSVFVIEI
jgi:2-polyprenyl-3-methyl-5-hydroxy-6-metoxy-1,4-benzoquinol methylase